MTKFRVLGLIAGLIVVSASLSSVTPATAAEISVRGRWSATVTTDDSTWLDAPYSLWCPTTVHIEGTLTASYVGRAALDAQFQICGGGPGSGPHFVLTTPSGTISADVVLWTLTSPGVVDVRIAQITGTGRFSGIDWGHSGITLLDVAVPLCGNPPPPGTSCGLQSAEDSGPVGGTIIR